MKKTTMVGVMAWGMVWATASGVAAQGGGPAGYVDFSIGAQLGSHTTTTTTTSPLYGETASASSSQKVGAGPVFDVGAGYRFAKNLGVGVSASVFTRGSDATVSLSIPSPVFYNSYTSASATASGLRHTEIGAHVKLFYVLPLRDKLDLTISGGPSFVRVSHAVASASFAAGSSTATVTSSEEKGNGLGANGGLDISYAASRRLGVGIFGRYVAASVDLASASGVKVGGAQAGGTLRLRF